MRQVQKLSDVYIIDCVLINGTREDYYAGRQGALDTRRITDIPSSSIAYDRQDQSARAFLPAPDQRGTWHPIALMRVIRYDTTSGDLEPDTVMEDADQIHWKDAFGEHGISLKTDTIIERRSSDGTVLSVTRRERSVNG